MGRGLQTRRERGAKFGGHETMLMNRRTTMKNASIRAIPAGRLSQALHSPADSRDTSRISSPTAASIRSPILQAVPWDHHSVKRPVCMSAETEPIGNNRQCNSQHCKHGQKSIHFQCHLTMSYEGNVRVFCVHNATGKRTNRKKFPNQRSPATVIMPIAIPKRATLRLKVFIRLLFHSVVPMHL